jgi:hypothetical protein
VVHIVIAVVSSVTHLLKMLLGHGRRVNKAPLYLIVTPPLYAECVTRNWNLNNCARDILALLKLPYFLLVII